MICADLPPAQEIRCLDELNIQVNKEIDKIRVSGKPCPFKTDDVTDVEGIADCDCYATEKVRRLNAQGYSARTRIVYIPRNGMMHRVAEVNGRILDNLSPWTYRTQDNRSVIWFGK